MYLGELSEDQLVEGIRIESALGTPGTITTSGSATSAAHYDERRNCAEIAGNRKCLWLPADCELRRHGL